MLIADPQCAALGVPAHLHRGARTEDQAFVDDEKLYRRHRLSERRLKAVINFEEMSVNRGKYCLSPSDVLVNTKDGGLHVGYGVCSFTVGATRALATSQEVGDQDQSYGAVVRHDIEAEPCNYSHSVVNGSANGVELPSGKALPKTAKKLLRRQLWQSVVIEIPAEQQGSLLEEGSWQ